VVFWDYYGDGTPAQPIYPIADTFEDFLASFCDEKTGLAP